MRKRLIDSINAANEREAPTAEELEGGKCGVRRVRLLDMLDVNTQEADDIIAQEKKRHQEDYIREIDQSSGASDSTNMTVEKAEKITGWRFKDLKIDRKNPKSATLRPHQLVGMYLNWQKSLGWQINSFFLFFTRYCGLSC